jgi:hypothetical protein
MVLFMRHILPDRAADRRTLYIFAGNRAGNALHCSMALLISLLHIASSGLLLSRENCTGIEGKKGFSHSR